MQLNLKIEAFDGPLDLLLALISKHKIDIFDIPISEIADQYTEYIEQMRELNMELTSEFIVMASELMLIKSKMLLPRKEDEEDPRKPLVDALLEHAKAKEAAEFLRDRADVYFDRFTREPAQTDGVYRREHEVGLLLEALSRISERISEAAEEEDEIELFTKIEKERYFTVEEKIDAIGKSLADGKKHSFSGLFYGSAGRGELIAIFLALLELIAKGMAALEKTDGEIYVIGQSAQ